MLTPRRSAQIGLGIACLILVSSVAVLVAGAADPANSNANIEVSNATPTVGHSSNVTQAETHSNTVPTEQR
jgi:hypothetical protein